MENKRQVDNCLWAKGGQKVYEVGLYDAEWLVGDLLLDLNRNQVGMR